MTYNIENLLNHFIEMGLKSSEFEDRICSILAEVEFESLQLGYKLTDEDLRLLVCLILS